MGKRFTSYLVYFRSNYPQNIQHVYPDIPDMRLGGVLAMSLTLIYRTSEFFYGNILAL
jgi:hypothetical protein